MATRGASSSVGLQNAAYVLERRSTSSPRPIAVRDRRAEGLAPGARDGAESRQGGVAGEAVGRDPVARADEPEERRW